MPDDFKLSAVDRYYLTLLKLAWNEGFELKNKKRFYKKYPLLAHTISNLTKNIR